MFHTVRHWLTRSLSHRLTMGLAVALTVSGLALGGLGLSISRHQMRQEQQQAADRLVATFEASLFNAMLQRDLPGLQSIIDTLGQADGIAQVRLLNRQGEVRFASQPSALGQQAAELCGPTPCAQAAPQLDTWRDVQDRPALTVAHRIANQARCTQCHGTPDQHPINGVLVIDFKPAAATFSDQPELVMTAAGLVALLLFGALLTWTLRRQVSQPLANMQAVTARIARGDFSQRLPVGQLDEIGQVGQHLNTMADDLQALVGRLRKQQDFLQDLLDAMPDPVLVITQDWRIRLANKAYADLVGQPLQDIHNQCCYRVGKARNEPCPATLVTCPVLESRSGSSLRTVMSLVNREGKEVPVEIDSTSVTLDGERLTVEVLRPLERTIRFSQEQRLSTIGLLANGVAHEIHNPLTSIRLALQASIRGIRKGDMSSQELMSYLQIVDAQIDRCVHTTQRLMQMSVPPDGQLVPVAIVPAVDDVLALMAEEAKGRRVQLDVDIRPSDLAVLADEAELRQIFINLVQNAMTALPGGGCIRIEAKPDGPQRVRIRVSDTGPGIAAENLPRIFLPFFSRRVDGSRGMGLGLAVCKTIVDRFGGTIEAGNQPGSGAVLTLTLLAVPPETAASPTGAYP